MSYRFFAVLLLVAFLIPGFAAPVPPYTQSGAGTSIAFGVPMGHEWITRMAAIELLGFTPLSVPDLPDPNDPRKKWTQGLAKNLNLSSPDAQAEVARIKGLVCDDDACGRYASRYAPIYDAFVGERWVDIAGYNVGTARQCFDDVAQEPAEIQYDHFMRRYDDRDGVGGVTAAKTSQQRFVAYFVAAAMAPSEMIDVYDGGLQNSTAVDVDRNYFLFGRAAHLFEDSFSLEHTVRIPADNYTRVRQVKSYLCAAGAEQHSHGIGPVLSYKSGDVIWKPGTGLSPLWGGYLASNMKNTPPGGKGGTTSDGAPLVATEATKDLWAAFIRTMGTPIAQREAAARAEAATLVNNWLSYNEQEMLNWYNNNDNRGDTYVLGTNQSGKGQTVKQCMVSLDVGTDNQMIYVHQLEEGQRQCLYNALPWAGYSDLFDTSQHIWFTWRWRNGPLSPLLDAPASWKIPYFPADSGVRMSIKSNANQQYMSADSSDWVYCKTGTTPLDFIQVGSKQDATFRVADSPRKFLSYRIVPKPDGAVDLYAPGWTIDPTDYTIASTPAAGAWSILSKSWQDYMWLFSGTQSPYISGAGDPINSDSQWIFDESAPVGLTTFTIPSQDPVKNPVYYYSTDTTIPPNFEVKKPASFRGFAYAVPGTVPVYLYTIRMGDSAGTLVYYYLTDPKTPPSFRNSGIAFYAFNSQQPGTVAVNLFTASAQDPARTQLYYYSSTNDAPPGYVNRGVVFWAPQVFGL
jgi:hypothetical protein